MDAQMHMDVQALVNRAEQASMMTAALIEERNRMQCPSVDETFIPFRRALAARQAQCQPKTEATPAPASSPSTETSDQEAYSTNLEDAGLFAGAMGGTLILVMLVAHGAGWIAGVL